MQHTPKQYTELVGATKYPLDATNIWYFIFGGEIHYASKAKSKWQDGKLYAEIWSAKENIRRWKGKFINGWSMMTPIEDGILNDVDEAMKLLKSGNEKIAEGSAEVRKALAVLQRGPDAELDKMTMNIMRAVTQTKHT